MTGTFCETVGVELNGVTEDKEFSIEGVHKPIDKYRNGSQGGIQAAS